MGPCVRRGGASEDINVMNDSGLAERERERDQDSLAQALDDFDHFRRPRLTVVTITSLRLLGRDLEEERGGLEVQATVL